MKKLILTLLAVCTFVSAFAQERPYTKVDTYFSGTNYELNVYRIYGRRPGKTMLILGGIQGDEPGGFLSADSYAGLQLEQGDLIVVPRANFKSVILYDRGPDGDMNRRFQENRESLEMDKVVTVVKKLMGEADVFINLHDGWGYHSPVDIDNNRNHKKFGQSVITDADVYTCQSGKKIDLKGPAAKVLDVVNKKIDDDRYKLHYFNTDTSDPDTQFKDMRKTATYYALTHYCMPAFGIESSKNLPSVDMKVLYHNYAVNEFMKAYGVIPEYPAVLIQKAVMQYAVILVNDQPVRVNRGETLTVRPGDVCEIVHVETNYDRGVSADLVGYGSLNDMNVKYAIKSNSAIIFRKDSVKIGAININVSRNAAIYAAKNAEPVADKPQFKTVVKAEAKEETKTQEQPEQAAKQEKAPETFVVAPAVPVTSIEPAQAVSRPAPDETKTVKAEDKPAMTEQPMPLTGYSLLLKHNGQTVRVADGVTYNVKVGDRLVIIAIYKGETNLNLPINLKGYYSPTDPQNSGDDRNYVIKMLPAKFMKKYAIDKAKMTYPVVVKQDNAEIAKFNIEMQ